MSPATIEAIGYIASALIVASLAMTSVLKLRALSLLGSIAYLVYGVLLPAWPIVIANGIIAVLNVWNIYRELNRSKMNLAVSPIDADAPYLLDFLDASRSDIDTFQPGAQPAAGDRAWLLLRDSLPAGALVGRVEGGDLQVKLDYVRPPFRDSRLGEWLFGDGFKNLGLPGVTRIVADPGTAEHRRYLLGLGFAPDGERVSRPVR